MLDTAPVATTLNRPTTVLTDKGQAVRHLYRLVNAMRALDAASRSDVLLVLRDEIAEMPVTA